MRFLPFLALFSAACATTNAQVPDVDRSGAIDLVRHDLEILAEHPTEVHWHRAYRHFDRHLEPHLSRSDRLDFELRFGNVRHRLKLGDPGQLGLKEEIKSILDALQPSD